MSYVFFFYRPIIPLTLFADYTPESHSPIEVPPVLAILTGSLSLSLSLSLSSSSSSSSSSSLNF